MRERAQRLVAGGVLGLSLLLIGEVGAQSISGRMCDIEAMEGRRVARDKDRGLSMLDTLRRLDERDTLTLTPAVRQLVPVIYEKNLTPDQAAQLAETACLITKR